MSRFSWESAASRGSKYPRAEGISHSREVHGALIEFDVQYGTFPNASTIPKVRNDTATSLDLGTKSSNDYLRQILALGFGNEKMFGIRSRRFSMPDNRFDGAEALKRGECGFAYVVGLSTSDDPTTPLLITPVIPGSNRFDPDPFYHKAVILRIDGSAMSYPIMKDGKIDMGGGVHLDPAKPMWNGKPLIIAWPE